MRSTKGSWTPTGSRSSRSRIAARFVAGGGDRVEQLAVGGREAHLRRLRLRARRGHRRLQRLHVVDLGVNRQLEAGDQGADTIGEVEVEAEVVNQPREIGIGLDLSRRSASRSTSAADDARAFGEGHTRGDS